MSDYVYAFAMDAPGRYLVGRSADSPDDVRAAGGACLQMPVHLTIAANQQHVVPIDVVGDFYVRLDKYVGFGELRAEFVAACRCLYI